MPRQRHNDPSVKVGASVPQTLLRRVQAWLRDPYTGKVKYGALSALITRLLREWVEAQEKAAENQQEKEDA